MRAKHKSGECEAINASNLAILAVSVIIILSAGSLNAAPNWVIYADANIAEGDQYNIVEVHDSLTVPPVQTTVTMSGGFVTSLGSFDSSIVNVWGGDLSRLGSYDVSTINIHGGTVTDLLWVRDYSTHNIDGGITAIIEVSDSATVNLRGGMVDDYIFASGEPGLAINIYGTDFFYDPLAGNYGGGQLSGRWADSTAFAIDFYGGSHPGAGTYDSYSYVVLNTVPEPSSLVLFGLIAVFGRKLARRRF